MKKDVMFFLILLIVLPFLNADVISVNSGGDAFYDKEWVYRNGEIEVGNDRVYFEPLSDDPFTIKANMYGDFTASWTTSILQLYYQGLHELTHEGQARNRREINGHFEEILRERNIDVSETGISPIEYKTKTSEAYANLYAILVSLKYQHEEEQYIIDNHRFTFKDYNGNIIKKDVKLESLDLTPIIEYYFYTNFSHTDVSCPYYFIANEQDKTIIRQKLDELKTHTDEFLLPFYGVSPQ